MAQWISLEETAGLVPDRISLALGGAHRMAPLALIKEVIKRGIRDLHLITTPTGGFGAELLLAAGAVTKVETAQVSLGEFGIAPAFRQAAEKQGVPVKEGS